MTSGFTTCEIVIHPKCLQGQPVIPIIKKETGRGGVGSPETLRAMTLRKASKTLSTVTNGTQGRGTAILTGTAAFPLIAPPPPFLKPRLKYLQQNLQLCFLSWLLEFSQGLNPCTLVGPELVSLKARGSPQLRKVAAYSCLGTPTTGRCPALWQAKVCV